MSDPVCGAEIDPPSLQKGDQYGSHNDCRHTECGAAPTLAPDPVSILHSWIPDSLNEEISGDYPGKKHPGNGQEKFTDGHVSEVPVERSEWEDFMKSDIGEQQQYERPQNGCTRALKLVGLLCRIGAQLKSCR